jgi:RNase P subunit RPR2
MTDGSEPQPEEIYRIACSKCGSHLKLETSIPKRVGHPRYDVMRCVRCGTVQWIADEIV